jgi:parallel beta-helix repeat protein
VNLFSGSENTGNQITDNEVVGNHWGILVNNSAGNTGNVIRNNRIRDNARAGVAALALASGNTIEGNDARGNGLLNLGPSLLFDLFDAPPLNNTWRDNQGTPNFTTASVITAPFDDRIVAEAFSAGGCLAPARIQ